jgi:hypothetical protein
VFQESITNQFCCFKFNRQSLKSFMMQLSISNQKDSIKALFILFTASNSIKVSQQQISNHHSNQTHHRFYLEPQFLLIFSHCYQTFPFNFPHRKLSISPKSLQLFIIQNFIHSSFYQRSFLTSMKNPFLSLILQLLTCEASAKHQSW